MSWVEFGFENKIPYIARMCAEFPIYTMQIADERNSSDK